MSARRPCATVLLAAAALLGACAMRPGYGEISGSAGAAPGLDLASTEIVGIDGRLLFDSRETWWLEPGTHDVLVVSTRRGRRFTVANELQIVVAPCMRYVIAARHTHALADAGWTPEVLRQEPIKGCKPR